MPEDKSAALARGSWARFGRFAPNDPGINALAKASQSKRLKAGAVLVQEGDQDGTVYVVAAGALRTVRHTENGHEIWYSDVGAGGLIGELAALTGAPRTSSAVAKTDATVFGVAQDLFVEIAGAHANIGLALARMLAHRLNATSTQVADLVAMPVPHRLHNELVRMATPDADDDEIFLVRKPPTVSSLAQRIHATREATSRALGELETRGLVRRADQKWIVVAPAGSA